MSEDDGLSEERIRDVMVRQLRRNLSRCRRVILDERMDLKTRERWTQLYTNTSKILNAILNDRQMRDWEKRLREVEAYRKRGGLEIQKSSKDPEPASNRETTN